MSGETYDGPVVEDPSGRVHHVADLGPFTVLDATATCDAGGGALTVAVVNRDRDRAHAATMPRVAGASSTASPPIL